MSIAIETAATTEVWTEQGFVEDAWHLPAENREPDDDTLLPLDALEEALEARAGRNVPLGVLLQPGDDVERLRPHLDRLALVAIAFPAYTDGRGYSMAALLRERLGYRGDMRAVGDVLLDQVPYMLRCGFTSLAVTHAPTRARLQAGDIPGVTLHTQPTARDEPRTGGYSWRRGTL